MKRTATYSWYPYILGAGVILVTIITTFGIFTLIRHAPSDVISGDIQTLQKIFETINREAVIIDFEDDRTPVNFLTVEKFVGSSVGGMNLRNPHNWHGPYLADNPTIQEKHYVILKTAHGHYIVPDAGVELSSGKIIGQDIMLDHSSNIDMLIADGTLSNNSAPLAAKISVGGTPRAPIIVPEEE